MQVFLRIRKLWILGFGIILALSACSQKVMTWEAPPEMTIDPSKIYLATLKTEKGDIQIELFADRAPKTVNNFKFLADEGYYDDTTFHRVIEGFMAQAGDPTATGGGGPGYTFEDEFHPSLKFDDAGYLAMGNRGSDTNGSQFFITYSPQPHLTGAHTIFGKVVEGMDVVLKLTPRDADSEFDGDALLAIEIKEIPETLLPTPESMSILQWETPPEMFIDTAKIYLATLKTDKGDVQVELFADRAPLTVNNFIFLAGEGYYDNTTFHRVIPGFMAQAGDPTAVGNGGPGYNFEDEFHPSLQFDDGGYLGMANAGPNSNGSQFFITYSPQPHLSGAHTIFGKVVKGMDVVLNLTPRDPSSDFDGDAMLTIEIEEIPESILPPPTPTSIPIVPKPETGRPLAALDVADRANLYTGKPEMQIDPSKTYRAVIETSQGEFVIGLKPEAAPESVNNFVVLADLGFYDGFPIAFVDPTAFVLTGSPTGEENSDIGYSLPAEVGLSHVRGAVGIWVPQDTRTPSGSQFYIMVQDVEMLDADFPIFGEVVEGMEIVDLLTLDDLIVMITIEVQ